MVGVTQDPMASLVSLSEYIEKGLLPKVFNTQDGQVSYEFKGLQFSKEGGVRAIVRQYSVDPSKKLATEMAVISVMTATELNRYLGGGW